jgi:hypothetical protein
MELGRKVNGLQANLGTGQEVYLEVGVRSARFSRLPVRPQVPRRHNCRIIAESLMGLVSRGLLDVINQDELAGSVGWLKV